MCLDLSFLRLNLSFLRCEVVFALFDLLSGILLRCTKSALVFFVFVCQPLHFLPHLCLLFPQLIALGTGLVFFFVKLVDLSLLLIDDAFLVCENPLEPIFLDIKGHFLPAYVSKLFT
jgi:hypothetical protein